MTEPPAAAPARLRPAREDDAPALLDIYRPIVEHTAISFELEPPSVEEMARRVREHGAFAPYLVCEEADHGGLLGFAYAAPFRPRRAYRFTVETTVYVAEAARRRGVARALYGALLDGLRDQGFVTAVAGIALPNDASVALHETLGFERAALLPAVGYKLGAWRDVGWWALALLAPRAEPEEPRSPPSALELRRWRARRAPCAGLAPPGAPLCGAISPSSAPRSPTATAFVETTMSRYR